MFQEDRNSIQFQSSDNMGSDSHEKSCGNKRTKNIRKQSKKSKKLIEEIENMPRHKLSKEQKLELQKQKNRRAAQLSRDRQKIFVSELEKKVQFLQNQLQKQVCYKCGQRLAQQSSTDEQKFDSEFLRAQSINLAREEDNNPQQLFEQNPPFQFYRQESSISVNSIGKFLFIFMIAVAIFSFSASVEPQSNSISGRLMQQIVPYSEFSHPKYTYSTIFDNNQSEKQYEFPLKDFTSAQNDPLFSEQNECKAQFIENYFGEENKYESNSYEYGLSRNRLMNCTKPQLIMRTGQDRENGFFEGLFTLVLDDPEIIEVTSKNGGLTLSNIVPLKGLYELQVQFMKIRKIIGQNCLN